jgi:hypothetical protein
MTVVKLTRLPEEALGRPLVVLDPRFVKARYDQVSFAKIASRKRQVSFGVTLVFRKESALKLPQVKAALEGEETIAIVCPSIPPSSASVRFVTMYTDVLPPRIALYLEPDVPDEFGEKARRLEELNKAVSEMKRQGLRIPPAVKAELEVEAGMDKGENLQETYEQAGLSEDNGPDSQRNVNHLVEGR